MKIIRIIAYFFRGISIVTLIFCIAVISFAYFFEPLNTYPGNLSNIIAYFTMVFTAFTLLVAYLVYKLTILRPKLKLRIGTWLYEKEGLALSVNPKSKIVSDCASLTSWRFWLENHGQTSAKYPMVQIILRDAFFPEDAFPGWNSVYHAHALGWYGFQWSPGNSVVVYQGLPVQLPTMYFSGKQIGDLMESGNSRKKEDCMEVEITIVADGIKKRTYTLPVKLEYSSDEG